MKKLSIAVGAMGLWLAAQSATAAVPTNIVFDTFNNLSAWSTFSTPATATTDTETDSRTVFAHTLANNSAAVIQRSWSSLTLTTTNLQLQSSLVFRRNTADGGGFLQLSMFQPIPGVSVVGDIQGLRLFYRPSDNRLTLAETLFNNTSGGLVVNNLWDVNMTGGGFPFNDLASDYSLLALTYDMSSYNYRIWDVIGGVTNTVATVASLSSTHNGALTTAELRIGNNSLAQSAMFVDSFSLDIVPEPSTVLLVGVGSLVLLRRKQRRS